MYAAKPAIPLERAKRAKYDPSELVKFKLYRNPEDTSSAKYTISIPKFSGGTPEEILNFFDQVQEVMTGQSITKGPMRYKVLQVYWKEIPLQSSIILQKNWEQKHWLITKSVNVR